MVLYTSVFVAVIMAVFVRVLYGMCGNGHHQATVLHALQSNEQVGKMGHSGRFAMDDQHFEARVVIQMGVAGGDN